METVDIPCSPVAATTVRARSGDLSPLFGRVVFLEDGRTVESRMTDGRGAGVVRGYWIGPTGDPELIVAFSDGRLRRYELGKILLPGTDRELRQALGSSPPARPRNELVQ